MSNIKKLFYHVSPFHKISESLQSQPGKKKKKTSQEPHALAREGYGQGKHGSFPGPFQIRPRLIRQFLGIGEFSCSACSASPWIIYHLKVSKIFLNIHLPNLHHPDLAYTFDWDSQIISFPRTNLSPTSTPPSPSISLDAFFGATSTGCNELFAMWKWSSANQSTWHLSKEGSGNGA